MNSAAHSARALLRVLRAGLTGGSFKLSSGTQAVWAGVAQLVEHLICNQRVGGSNPFVSSIFASSISVSRRSSLQAFHRAVVWFRGIERRIWLYCLPSWHSDLRSLLQGRLTRSILSWNQGAGLRGWAEGCTKGRRQQSAQVAERLMAADCKSATLRVTEVRILPCAPFILL